MQRKVGARGLRMILEELMLDLMYHLPSQKRDEGIRGHPRNGRDAGDVIPARHGKGRNKTNYFEVSPPDPIRQAVFYVSMSGAERAASSTCDRKKTQCNWLSHI